jgi:D-alanine-D-alanine ligase
MSSEREVSLASGEAVRQVLAESGMRVATIDTAAPRFLETVAETGADVVFIALHGRGGEDGTVQGALELMGMPYTGSGVLASALAMDKARTKLFYRESGLRTPTAWRVTRTALGDLAGDPEGCITRVLAHVGLPLVVKPVADGSSVGISIVHERTDLVHALNTGFAVSDELLVEAFIQGTEVTVPVLGNDEPEALPVIEIVPRNEFYDYESKYSEGGCEHIIPARISEAVARACTDAALKAHKALGCRGMSRTDFIVDIMGVPWAIETNTIPGMTATSLLPHAAAHAGISASELYQRIIGYALEG